MSFKHLEAKVAQAITEIKGRTLLNLKVLKYNPGIQNIHRVPVMQFTHPS